MVIDIDREEIKQVDDSSILQQTTLWAEIKRRQGLLPEAFRIRMNSADLYAKGQKEKLIEEDLLVFLQPFDRDHTIAYVPYGPLAEPSEENQGTFLEELSEMLRTCLPENCILIRYDLHWESPWAKEDNRFDVNGNWIGPPDKEHQELRINFCTHNHNLYKANTDILPSHTIFMDLNKDRDELLKTMKPKTRYNIRLSKKRGVHVRSIDEDDLGIWHDLYTETSKRNGIYASNIDYFRTLLHVNKNCSDSDAEVKLLLAEADEKPLAAMFLSISGNRGTYLYGASSSENRKFMATYALQWEAMNISRKKGCSEYDFFGISPTPDPNHPLYGLYRYKSGFGGKIFHRMGCWDYLLSPGKYDAVRAADMHNRGIHQVNV